MDSVKQDWQEKLQGMSSRVVFKAVAYLEDNNIKFPPTMPEFVSLCKANTPTEMQKALPRRYTQEEIEETQKKLEVIGETMRSIKPRDPKAWAKLVLADSSANDYVKQRARDALAKP